MGWQGFPDEVTDTRTRAEMLDESIDILTLLYERKQFDYAGRHYHLKLTLLDEIDYPPSQSSNRASHSGCQASGRAKNPCSGF
jgi:alkanesulfonate monooxygenase SsuD/methylene tetrahydromethanopterin reductase-like flavin-dependent oxidoreductase (luciferase family)